MVPASDDRSRRPSEEGQVSRSEDEHRRLVDLTQRGREQLVAREQCFGPELAHRR
jgi:hypothetical protein